MFKKVVCFIVLVPFLFSITGCASLAGYEKVKYERLQLRLQKCNLPELKSKDPVTAGALNLLVGLGNAYLDQWGLFAVNLLLWPWSVVWAIPQAAVDAGNINKKETLVHYEYGFGLEDLKKCEGGE